MAPMQKVIAFGYPQNPSMSTEPTARTHAPDLFDVKAARLPAEAAMSASWQDWLQDPRVQSLSGEAFRASCYLRVSLPPPLMSQHQSLRSELLRCGLFSAEDMLLLQSSVDHGDQPMVRLRSVGLIPVAWNERFIRFYEAYGMARDRGGAERAWAKLERASLQTPLDLEVVISGANRSRMEGAFRGANLIRKRPATWLNEGCWDDDIDAGEYPRSSLSLIDLFNRHCPRAEMVETYSPARSDAVRAALQRMDLDRWSHYFNACSQFPELFDFIKGPVPITTALSPEMERKVREAVRSLRNRQAKAAGAGA